MKGKAKIIVCIFSFLIAIIALATSTFAWFTAIKRSGNIVFVTGQVKYVLSGDFNQIDTITPFTELVNQDNQFTISNQSSIDSEIRMQISYQLIDSGVVADGWIIFADTAIGTTNSSNGSDKVMGTMCTNQNYEWKYSEGLWYFNHKNTDPQGTVTYDSVVKTDEKISIPILESLFVNGNAFGNDDIKLKKNLLIKLDFQAKQSKYVTWQELGSITISA